jgi:hypothetical protein
MNVNANLGECTITNVVSMEPIIYEHTVGGTTYRVNPTIFTFKEVNVNARYITGTKPLTAKTYNVNTGGSVYTTGTNFYSNLNINGGTFAGTACP